MNEQDLEDYERYKKVIDQDFSRLVRLEKGWIAHISHKIMPVAKGYEHEDRKELRDLLLKYLGRKVVKTPQVAKAHKKFVGSLR